MRKRSTLLVGATAAAIAAIAASVAVAGTVAGSANSLTAEAKISPKKLSKATPSPVSIEIATKTSGLNAVASAAVDLDKNGQYFAKGLPTCNAKVLASAPPSKAAGACGDATIGSGRATIVYAAPENRPLTIPASLTAYNGVAEGGKPTVVLYGYITSPVPTPFFSSGVVSNYKKEGFGTRLTIDFPKLFGGYGSVTELNLKLDKKFTSKGKKRSLISAKCPGSKKLKVRISFTYVGGETLAAPLTQTCKQKG